MEKKKIIAGRKSISQCLKPVVEHHYTHSSRLHRMIFKGWFSMFVFM